MSGPTSAPALPTRLGRNVIVNYATSATAAVAALVTTPILLHHLGTDNYGVWVLAGSVVAYLELLELGVGSATTKLVAEDAVRGDDAVVRTLNTNVAVLGVLGVVALILGAAIAPFVAGWFGVPASAWRAAEYAFSIMAVAIAVSVPLDAIGGALIAYQRLDLVSFSNAIRAIGAAAGGAAVAVAGGGIVAVTAVGAACGLSMHYVRWRMLRRLIPSVRLSARLVDVSRLRRTASASGWFMVRDTTAVVIDRVDLVVVGLVLGVRAVAVYAIGLKLAQLSMRAVQPFTVLFFPRASRLAAADERTALASLLVDGTRLTLAASVPVTLALMLLARPAITAWVGHGFGGAVTVLVLLAAARGARALTETAWWLLAGSGWIRWTSSLAVAEAVVNIACSVVFAHIFGPAGVALGTLIGVAVSRLPVALLLTQRATGVSCGAVFRGAVLPHVAPAVAAGLALAAVAPVLPSTVVAVLFAAVAAFALYGAVYGWLGATTAERRKAREVVVALRNRA